MHHVSGLLELAQERQSLLVSAILELSAVLARIITIGICQTSDHLSKTFDHQRTKHIVNKTIIKGQLITFTMCDYK